MFELPPNSIITNAHDSTKSGLNILHYHFYGCSIIIMIIGLVGAFTGKVNGMSFTDGLLFCGLGMLTFAASYYFLSYINRYMQIAFTPTEIIEIYKKKEIIRTIPVEDIEYISAIEIIPSRTRNIINLMGIDDEFKSVLNINFHKIFIETNKPIKGYYATPKIRDNKSLMVQYSNEVVEYIKKYYPNKIANPNTIFYK